MARDIMWNIIIIYIVKIKNATQLSEPLIYTVKILHNWAFNLHCKKYYTTEHLIYTVKNTTQLSI